jgi:hypothetical protein
MTWMPVAKVFVEGVEYTGDTLASVNITYGKADQSEKFRSSFGSISLISDGAGLPVALNNKVRIYLQNSSAVDELIFTGRISDITVTMLAPDWVETALTLVSPLAHLGRRLVGYDGYSEQYEGERIAAILYEAGQITWLQAGGTWADQTGTWLQYEAISGSIDTGLTTLHSYNLGSGSVTDFINICELSGQGFLYENTDGLLNYDDIKGRYDKQIALGWETIDPDNVLLSGTHAQISSQFTSTAVQVSNYNNQHTYLGTINSGVGEFGKLYENFETWIKNKADLETWMKWFLTRYGNDFPVLSSFAIPLSQLSDAQRDVMISMINGLPVEISGLPAAISATSYQGYVEGWQWRIQTGEVFIILNISPKQYSYWAALSPAPSNFTFTEL